MSLVVDGACQKDVPKISWMEIIHFFGHSLHTHTQFLASQLEAEGNFKQAEQYLLENNDWKSAISMYRKRDMWEDALRVARLNGGQDSVKQVAYLWAKSLGGEAGTKVLVGMGLVEVSIDYACEVCDFDLAMSLAQRHAKPKIKHVHRQQALFFEDKGDWVEVGCLFPGSSMFCCCTPPLIMISGTTALFPNRRNPSF